jgi:8-oxo-dGTP pyrophosphatase MutT (NUDIX family)
MYKVFINDIRLIILNKSESDYMLLWPKARVIDGVEVTPAELIELTRTVENPHLVVLTANSEKFFENLRSHFNVIEAAGGIVNLNNRKGPFLMIFRNGRWDLPKGKIEKGEDKESAAMREVSEECGIGKLRIRSHYEITYHTYTQNDRQYLKVTYWYRMISTDMSQPVPQSNEGIKEVKWASNDEVAFLLKDSYPSIQDLMAPLLNG